jgi:aarF domain-containing kinase
VESFERGAPLYEFLRNRSALNTQIAAVGVDTYLKMLLTDNFVHTDLHPGNILARMAGTAI